MSLIAVGLNHLTAPLELREKLAVPQADVSGSLERLAHQAGLSEVMLLSTCNRVEVYGVPQASDPGRIIHTLADMRGVHPSQFDGHYFAEGGQDAVRHIFRVSASLESMVIGEPQILGQVKDAFRVAREHGTVGALLDRCLTMAFRGAKRVRTETELARGGASVSSVAVDLATSIFGDLKGAKVALIGAGEMAQQAATYLRAEGAGDIVVVNRSAERGTALAQSVAGLYRPWEHFEAALIEADIVITSTAAREPIIDKSLMKKVMRKRRGRTIFLVDIAVPRDVHPHVGNLPQVLVYDIDDLQRLVAENMAARGSHKDAAARVVEEEIRAFMQWQRTRNIAPVMAGLQEFGNKVMRAELERMAPKLGGLEPAQQKAVEALAHGIVKKMLHSPMAQLREAVAQGHEPDMNAPDLAQALATLFALEDAPAPALPQTPDDED